MKTTSQYRSRLWGVILLGALAGAAYGDGAAVRVHNHTSTTVTVNSDTGYGRTANPCDTCTFVASVGPHKLVIQAHGKNPRQDPITVGANGYDLDLGEKGYQSNCQ